MSTRRQKHRLAAWLALAATTVTPAVFPLTAAHAQDAPNADAATASAPLSADQLDDLVGRIALYPDDLIGIVLPASTYPLQIVQAERFLEQREKNANLKPDDRWDDSVVALLNYPEVVKLLSDDLDWTSDLGEAVANQRADVLDAIQSFRDRAYAAGNLKTDDRQVVKREDDEISIAPANPEVIYVPYYEPEQVVVYQQRPAYYYYPIAYPVYYYPYPIGYRFQTGFFWGVTTAFTIGWHNHAVNVWRYGYFGHPYFGRTYYDPFYVRNHTHINVNIIERGGRTVWEPRYRHPARPIVVGTDHRAPSGTARAPATAPQRNVREGSAASGRYRSGTAADTRRDPRTITRAPQQPNGDNAVNAAERARRAGQAPQRPSTQSQAGQPAQQPSVQRQPGETQRQPSAQAQGQATEPRATERRYIQPRASGQGAVRGSDNRSGEDAATKRGNVQPQTQFRAPAPPAAAPQAAAPSAQRDAPRYQRGLGRSPQQTAPRVETRQVAPPPQASAPAPRIERPTVSAPQRAPTPSYGDRGSAARPSPAPAPRASANGGDGGARANGRSGGSSRGASHREVQRGGSDTRR
jgi:hypothetical protein